MTSNDDSTYDMVVFPPVRPPSLALGVDYVSDESRRPPVSESQFLAMFDSDGRVVAEHKLRQSIFKGNLMVINILGNIRLFLLHTIGKLIDICRLK